MSIFDNLKITIKYKNIDENPLAIATLNLNGEAEIRFAPILWTRDCRKLFFTMPSLKNFKYQNAFVILDETVFADIRARVIEEFKNGAKDFYHKNEFELIKNALAGDEDINPDDIPL